MIFFKKVKEHEKNTRNVVAVLLPHERVWSLHFARHVLKSSFDSIGNDYDILFESFIEINKGRAQEAQEVEEKTFCKMSTVDVILWSKGTLRGSRIVRNKPFSRAIYEAVLAAKEDIRFSPFRKDELVSTQIELVVIDSEGVPVTEKDVVGNEILPNKAYSCLYGGKIGWYVPATYAVKAFTSLRGLLDSLVYEKLESPRYAHVHIKNNNTEEPQFYTHSIEDYIEDATQEKCIVLNGSVVSTSTSTSTSTSVCGGYLQGNNYSISNDPCIKNALTHLALRQREDGSFPLLVSPIALRNDYLDWVRGACAGYSLALYGDRPQDGIDRYSFGDIAEKGFCFYASHIFKHTTMDLYTRMYCLIYFYKTAKVLGHNAEAERAHAYIIDRHQYLDYEPSIFLATAVHMLTHEKTSQGDVAYACTLWKKVYDDFLKKKSEYEVFVKHKSHRNMTAPRLELELSSYVDLAYVAVLLSGKGELLIQESKEITSWFSHLQNTNGSFPERSSAT